METISRTKKKKAAESLQAVGEKLVDLPEAQLEFLELPGDLKAAVRDARGMKSHGARRRQLQYIGRLMRHCDSDAVQEALDKLEARKNAERRRFKRVELWRDELVAGDDARLNWLKENFPDTDLQQLQHLVNCARGTARQMDAKEAARKLFRFLSRLEGDDQAPQ